MNPFHGEFCELQTVVSELGYKGQWSERNGKKVFRSEDKAILNWWPSSGTLQAQGPEALRKKLEEAITMALPGATSTTTSTTTVVTKNHSVEQSEKVFVVYGHDEGAREQLELVLHRLDLDPFVLGNTAGSGLTIIEALEREILSPQKDKRFGIVLLTPDDMGYKQGGGPENAEPRARQNVVREMGMLIAAFGRDRVAILKKGHVEVPSDASGIIYLPLNVHVKEAAAKLCQRLSEAGFELSPDSIARASA